MPRTLVLEFKNAQLACTPEKVDRTSLYGFIDIEALDSKGRKCQLATLADDGRTLVGTGGSAFGYVSPDGLWLEKSKLQPVNSEGKPITPVPSSYDAPIPLTTTATIDQYLSYNIKGVYVMKIEGDAAALASELKSGTIYTFPYSFRGGLESDVGFLLAGADGSIFFAVGQPTSLHFVGLEQVLPAEPEGEEQGDDESVDFSMM
jgi:hypothetical protein